MTNNDTSTLNGALAELGETMANNLEAKGVTASASDGLTTLANKILTIQASCYHIEFSEDSYVAVGGSATLEISLQENYAPKVGATVTVTGSDSSLYSGITNSNGVATITVTNIAVETTFTCSYNNVTDTCTVTVSNVLFYDDATTDSSSRYTRANTNCSFTYDSDGYYVLSKTNGSGTSGIKINDTTFPKNVKITVDVYMTTNANTQPKLLFKNPSATYGYTPRLTYINNKASIIQGHYTGEGSSITGDVSYTQSLNTWYTFEFIHNDGALTFNIYKEGTLDKTLTATGSLSIADTGNEVGMCVAADTGKTYRFKNLKVEAL